MTKSRIKTACVIMTGPDVLMDQRGDTYEPANALPVKCPHCTFPDLDFIANPYVLTKGVSSPAETSPAQLGNFLVRERVRRILEIVVPDACAFHPTKSGNPKNQLRGGWLFRNTKLQRLSRNQFRHCAQSATSQKFGAVRWRRLGKE